MNRQPVERILDDLTRDAYAAGAAGAEQVDGFDGYVDRVLALDDRTWVGEAKAAFDQALNEAGNRDGFPSPDFWVSRAQAAAAIAAAEQAHIANLIAWKALQAARAGSSTVSLTAGGGDAVTERIEEGLGIA